jgi:hypothetical protein
MALLTELSESDQGALLDFSRSYREVMGEICRVFGKLSLLEDAWAGRVASIVALLDDAEFVSPTSDLAGAGPIAKQAMVATMVDFNQAMTLFFGPQSRQSYINAVGLSNALGR